MDRAGITRAVLGLAGPGVQVERDVPTAVRRAREANDFLAREIARRPDRYSGFAHLAMQDPKARRRRAGALRRAAGLLRRHDQRPHPRHLPRRRRRSIRSGSARKRSAFRSICTPPIPVRPAPVLDGHNGLRRATWEWGFETGSHALRMVFGGTFDRFPRAKLVLGHLGETLPYLLWRFDSRAKLYGVKLARSPSETIKSNIWVTLSGMFSKEPLDCALAALGPDRVMFSADYPFEQVEEAGHFMDTVPLPPTCAPASHQATPRACCNSDAHDADTTMKKGRDEQRSPGLVVQIAKCATTSSSARLEFPSGTPRSAAAGAAAARSHRRPAPSAS